MIVPNGAIILFFASGRDLCFENRAKIVTFADYELQNLSS